MMNLMVLFLRIEKILLESFPGVGRKTINVFLSEFYNEATIAVDTHVERVSKKAWNSF